MKRNNIISDWLNEYGDLEIDKFVENQLNQNKMKVILEFNLPDEQAEHYCAMKGVDMLNVLFELRMKLRGMLKYGELTDEQYKIVEEIQHSLIESLNDNEINLDK